MLLFFSLLNPRQSYLHLLRDPTWKDLFVDGTHLLEEGERIQRPTLARTLEKIAIGGADAFYKVSNDRFDAP